jgi:hypothetical protein
LAIPCSDGYTCPAGTTCDFDGPAPADAHGCAPVSCSKDPTVCNPIETCTPSAVPGLSTCEHKTPCAADDDCACGACVNAVCQNGPGFCDLL